jgi:hypothetical protein
MIYNATLKRENGTTYVSGIETTRGKKEAEKIAKTMAESNGHELVSVIEQGELENDNPGAEAAREETLARASEEEPTDG